MASRKSTAKLLIILVVLLIAFLAYLPPERGVHAGEI